MTGVRLAGGERSRRRHRDRRRDAARAAADGRRCRGWYRTALRALHVPAPATRQGRLGARRPDPVAERGRRAAPARSTSAAARTSSCARSAGSRRPADTRSCCSASRASPTRRARRRASTPPGPTRTARSDVDWTRAHRRAHRGAGRALRARLPRPHPRPPRARPGRRCEARNANLIGGDVGGGSYRARQVVFRPVPTLSPYRTPLDGPLHRQRRDVPGRRGPRRAGRRRRPRRAAPRVVFARRPYQGHEGDPRNPAACSAFAPAAHAAPYRVYGCHGPDDEPLSMHAFATYEVPYDTIEPRRPLPR